jgi:hypothetical protein
MTSFIWTINDLERTTADGFVILAKFGVTASDGVNTTGMTSAACWTQDPDKPIIPYEDLTEEIVLGWVKEAAPDTEANLQVTLDLMAAPMEATGMPWVA